MIMNTNSDVKHLPMTTCQVCRGPSHSSHPSKLTFLLSFGRVERPPPGRFLSDSRHPQWCRIPAATLGTAVHPKASTERAAAAGCDRGLLAAGAAHRDEPGELESGDDRVLREQDLLTLDAASSRRFPVTVTRGEGTVNWLVTVV